MGIRQVVVQGWSSTAQAWSFAVAEGKANGTELCVPQFSERESKRKGKLSSPSFFAQLFRFSSVSARLVVFLQFRLA
ncbi:hypothetical protein KC19_11G081400 [Ceratodon purpureus]|uniref:Uncharacterized protein n=1 Tax=Ceratodon purpureus TaxID=3225 RepID=A0A8T0GCT7_CERPU|nr:hypothetical protein KC19_11G081400 [Ceratodon purpureus]